MKILHLSTYDYQGGASKGAYRLHRALSRIAGITSLMGVKYKTMDENDIVQMRLASRKSVQYLAELCEACLLRFFQGGGKIPFSMPFMPNNLVYVIKNIAPDIIHLHWFVDTYIGYRQLEQIAQLKIPVVLTARDTWAFTGGCHYYGNCHKWQSKCTMPCPSLDKNMIYDVVNWQWNRKYGSYKKINPTVIALSKYFQKDIAESGLLSNYRCINLPNTIDTKIFRPIDKYTARALLGVNQKKKYILFGAVSATSDPRKGYDLLQKSLIKLSCSREEVNCLVFGASHGNDDRQFPLPVHYLGHLHDELTLTLAYSASDVFVCPSRAESFSNTTLESLACGTPVVGFSVGGIPDMIEHGINGMLATPHDPEELAAGISFVLEDEERRQRMGEAARRTVEERYAMPVVAKQYIALYEKILAERR